MYFGWQICILKIVALRLVSLEKSLIIHFNVLRSLFIVFLGDANHVQIKILV